MQGVRVTFGMIVCNGLPFLPYNLEALYPFAHQIIVVEGACRAAATTVRPDGHSSDGTWEALLEFAARHDPEKKLVIVAAVGEGLADGFWEEKGQMSAAYARRATGNWLWQVDVDEFYMPDDMARMTELLATRGGIGAVSFEFFNFWGGPQFELDGYAFRTADHRVDRIFAWRPGYRYVSHRPPTVEDANGRDVRDNGWLTHRETASMGMHMFHYDMILPKQADAKSAYYSRVAWHTLDGGKVREWKDRVFDRFERPFHVYTVYTHLSWLKPYHGAHPPAVERMLHDIADGAWPGISLRNTSDIARVLGGWRFRILRPFAAGCATFEARMYDSKMNFRRFLMRSPFWGAIQHLRGRRATR